MLSVNKTVKEGHISIFSEDTMQFPKMNMPNMGFLIGKNRTKSLVQEMKALSLNLWESITL